jgi:hypothetical protein
MSAENIASIGRIREDICSVLLLDDELTIWIHGGFRAVAVHPLDLSMSPHSHHSKAL